MTATVLSFTTDFPEFASVPEPQIAFWLNVAVNMVNEDRWGDLTDTGVELLAAHHIAIFRKAFTDSKTNPQALIGASQGVLASKAVDGASGGYDIAAATIQDAGNLNLTAYGTTFARLAKIFGAGGLQVTGGFGFEAYLAYGGPAGGMSGGAGGGPGGF